VLVVDGLGHGAPAAQCAAAATEAFEETRAEEPVEILAAAHDALRPTRGAAVAAAVLDSRRREVRYAGIGNISGIICTSARTTHMVSQPGIVGHNTRRVREFTYPWPVDALVLLYSDGIATHWSLDAYPGLAGRDPSIIAGIIYRDWNRGRDDATVVVVRERPEA
jgi:serine phosphatase RsbU (regulator of sigma subunit)